MDPHKPNLGIDIVSKLSFPFFCPQSANAHHYTFLNMFMEVAPSVMHGALGVS
jgi:hypothetical protein